MAPNAAPSLANNALMSVSVLFILAFDLSVGQVKALLLFSNYSSRVGGVAISDDSTEVRASLLILFHGQTVLLE
jgi:hypothetical protein